MSNRIRHVGPLLVAAYTCMSAARAEPVVTPLLDASPGGGTSIAVVPGSVQYSGAASASGTFTNGGTGHTGLGIDRGAVLMTRDAVHRRRHRVSGDDTNKSHDFTAGVALDDVGDSALLIRGGSLFAVLESSAPVLALAALAFLGLARRRSGTSAAQPL